MPKIMKRGPGRPPKNAGPTLVAAPKRRGRPPGSKNKRAARDPSRSSLTFMEQVSKQGDTLEASLNAFIATLTEAHKVEVAVHPSPEAKVLADALALVAQCPELITKTYETLANIGEDFAPGIVEKKELSWEPGSFVIFKNPMLVKAYGKDAFEIQELLELGKGPGNGTMVKLENGMFPKAQLELVDAEGFEEAEGTVEAAAEDASEDEPDEDVDENPVAVAPVIRKNGLTMPVAVLAKPAQVVHDDDLNA